MAGRRRPQRRAPHGHPVSTSLGLLAAKLVAAPFGGLGNLPGFLAGIVVGGGLGIFLFVAIWILGAVLFKRTEHQGSGVFRILWGAGGAFFGLLVGLAVLWGGISIVRSLGTFAESRVETRPDKRRPAQPRVANGLLTLKESLELGSAGRLLESVDALPPDFYELVLQIGKVTSDQQTMLRFLEYPGIQKILQNPRILDLMNDPSVIRASTEKNIFLLLGNKTVAAAVEDPALAEQLKKIDSASRTQIRTGISPAFSFTLSGAVSEETKVTLMPKYIATIGLEVHVQLKTQTKMFCSCAVEHGAEPNTNVCPVCLGFPGALPVMNEEALRLTALAGLMLGCEIPEVCKFDRKNYFYPDMPKNYQISQYDLPFCLGGAVPLHDLAYPKDAQKSIATKDKKIRLVRIHLEEDVAKSFHMENTTGIDFNRAGTPLLEIVSEPDIAAPEEAFAYLAVLQQVVIYGGISDADMEKGQLRCDVNVSVRLAETEEWGTKIELKNLNSISGVRRALDFEIRRQIEVLEAGGTLEQETRRWDDVRGETQLMRVKESAHDYRYFPDPDLLPVKTASILEAARLREPELPWEKRARYVADFGVTEYDAAVLASDLSTAGYFEAAAEGAKKPKSVANWILNDLQSALSAANKTIAECPITPAAFDELVNLIEDGKINSKQGKEVFAEMFASGRPATEIVKERGLEQVSDTGAIEALADEVIRANPGPAADFRGGKMAALNFLKGQLMKLSKGKANPQLAGEILQKKLGS